MGSAKIVSVILVILFLLNMRCHAQLSSTFYEKTCPNVLSTIRTSIRQAVASERRMAASLIRLHFHDCFVQVGGPSWTVMLRRRDSTTANSDLPSKSVWSKCLVPEYTTLTTRVRILAHAKQIYLQMRVSDYKKKNSDLPFFKSSLDELISNFEKKGLNARDMVVLSGAHTIGQAQCFTFRDRIYDNGSNIDAAFASRRKQNCPTRGGNSEVAPLDFVTPHKFDNNYFKNLMQKKGLLHSDQVLFNGGSTDNIVSAYSKNPLVFKSEFATAMIKMGNIEPLTGTEGVIKKICSTLN